MRQEAERSWEAGTRNAFNEYVENATNAALQAQTLFGNAFRSMEDALVNFVKTGKFDFKSLADSIISDIIRIQVRAQMSKILSESGIGSGGFGGLLSSLFGGSGGTGASVDAGTFEGLQGAGVQGLDLLALADGGPVNPGGMHLVGEEGPELFVPSGAGKIIPNDQLGSGVTVVQNIRVDSRSDAASIMTAMVRAKDAAVQEIRARMNDKGSARI
jgi:phage-related minor tail protein